MNGAHSLFVAIAVLIASFLGAIHGADLAVRGMMLPAAPEATVLFGGDMMFDRTIRTTINVKGGDYVFSCLDLLLAQQDVVVANLEGPITANASVSAGSAVGAPENFTFTFPIATAALLAVHHIGIVNLGNNHIDNFQTAGERSTIAALARGGVGYFGDPLAQTVATTSVRGITLALINYNQFSNTSSASMTITQIRAAKAAGEIAVVYTHWGEEYRPATVDETILAHRFVDAGANIVIGSHPHIVQEHERYRGKYIYYSLGNLIFDQYWNDAVDHGTMLSVTFSPTGVQRIREIPVVLQRDRRTCPVD